MCPRPDKHKRANHGFTLLELLIAVAVFAIMSVMAYGGLSSVILNSTATELELKKIQSVQRAMLTMTRDFTSETLGGATIMNVAFDCEPQGGYQSLIFDEFGGPVRNLTSDTPSDGGSLLVQGRLADYRIDVQPITGRVVVTRSLRDVPGP